MSSRKPRNTSQIPPPLLLVAETALVQSILGSKVIPRFASLVSHHHTAWFRTVSPLIANRGGRLVLETLEPLPGDRKCFRMINGVLVERTVKDVIPALRTNAEGLKKVLDDLVKQYKAKQDELDKWKVCGQDPYLGPNCTTVWP